MMWRTPSLAVNAAQTADENCGPLSEVMCDGTPNLATQPDIKAAAQSSAAVAASGTASHHLVERSIMVKI
jgi:hypothetical protein